MLSTQNCGKAEWSGGLIYSTWRDNGKVTEALGSLSHKMMPP